MIKILRMLLLPISILYGVVTIIRNWMFDVGILKSKAFEIPVICVGNLSVGGTGKTPQVEYLIRLLQNKYKTAILSRGYKRKTKGFVLANRNTKVLDIGDEPYQYHQKFERVQVAVEEDRVKGVKKILKHQPKTELVILDDAFQHRKIKAGFNILLSSYDKLFYNDFMMPTGNLRELWWGKNRAHFIMITKCPENLTIQQQDDIIKKVKPKKYQHVFFTSIAYAQVLKGRKEVSLSSLKHKKVILVTGIAKPLPLVNYLASKGVCLEHLNFPDHHHFTEKELEMIEEKSKTHRIITTEKDFVRLQTSIENLYYLPIEINFLNQKEKFDTQVLNFMKPYSFN